MLQDVAAVRLATRQEIELDIIARRRERNLRIALMLLGGLVIAFVSYFATRAVTKGRIAELETTVLVKVAQQEERISALRRDVDRIMGFGHTDYEETGRGEEEREEAVGAEGSDSCQDEGAPDEDDRAEESR
jgi:hypothetical protein